MPSWHNTYYRQVIIQDPLLLVYDHRDSYCYSLPCPFLNMPSFLTFWRWKTNMLFAHLQGTCKAVIVLLAQRTLPDRRCLTLLMSKEAMQQIPW